MFNVKVMELNTIIKQLLAGGIAGCCAKTVIGPLDRTKILLQAHHPYYREFGIFRCMWEIGRREGPMSLWKGNTMMMIRIFPYAAIQFFSFERYKNFYETLWSGWHFNKLLAGSSAGVTSVVCTYPLDMVRTRIAFQITGEHRYKNIPHAFRTIYFKEGGIRAFYRGMSATIVGMVPYAGVSFYTFTTLKDLCIKLWPGTLARQDMHSPDTLVLRTWVSLGCGGLAGAISQTVSFPCDVARRRMQLAAVLPDSHKYQGIWSTLVAVYTQHGMVKGLYRGLSINYLRVVPQQAVAFTVYEFVKELVGLN
ncbi:unnamed protein product [Clavelina lepadiformis]|uniref:Uncharacterized protein n=1 Tax=Clavelina lepadiformis TaxID=159417 RepID=A0ABP0EZU7_CLALP